MRRVSFEKGILYASMKCPKCRVEMAKVCDKAINHLFWRCRKCQRKRSVFYKSFIDGSKLPANEVLFLAYLWILKCLFTVILEMTDHLRHTITGYLGIFRDLITQDVEETQKKIGGPGIVIELI